MKPTIGVFISTTGDKRLATTLRSIAQQKLLPGDRVLVNSDGPMSWDVRSLVESHGFEYAERPKRDSAEWGHGQMNESIEALRGTVDIITGQDQDDVYAPRAFETMRARFAEKPGLLMSRVYNHAWGLLWRTPDWDEKLRPGDDQNMALDGHCPWLPGREERLPRFGLQYNGDQEFVQAARLLFWNRTTWCEEITTITRPELTLGWKLVATAVSTPEQVEALRVIRNSCRDYMTGYAKEISPAEQKAWWKVLDHDTHWAWLFSLPEAPDEYIAFAYLRYRDGVMWPTYGLAPEARGRGLGTEVIQFSLLAAQGPLRGNLLASNEPVKKLDYKLGWEPIEEHDGIIEVRYPWPPRFLKTP